METSGYQAIRLMKGEQSKKQYRELTIQNNFMITKVMSDERLMKKLLERIFPSMNIKDLKVVIKEKHWVNLLPPMVSASMYTVKMTRRSMR